MVLTLCKYRQIIAFAELARKSEVIFYYMGYFSQAIITAMAETVKLQLEAEGLDGSARRRLFSSFIEMAQNIIHYSSDGLTPSDQTDREMRHGSVMIARDEENYALICANPVASVDVEELRGILEPLRTMTLAEIKQAFRDSLRTETPEGSKGGGLGFLTMARDAAEPLEFDLVPETGDPDHLTFYLKATI